MEMTILIMNSNMSCQRKKEARYFRKNIEKMKKFLNSNKG